jgi:DNA-binding NtrC family response regulator
MIGSHVSGDDSVRHAELPVQTAPRVLVIEDDDPVRTIIGRLLTGAGFEPILAKGAADAEAHLSESIALLLLDFRIPGSRGDLFFYYASSRYPILRRRTVFLTGDTTAEVERMVSHTGCLLRHKPFVNSSLISLLWSLVEPGGQRHQPGRNPVG